jgi:peptidyl-tRNA hydrolase
MRDFVLSRPGPQDGPLFLEGVKKAQEALWRWILEGLSATMNQYNTKNRSAGAEDDAAGDEKPKTQA